MGRGPGEEEHQLGGDLETDGFEVRGLFESVIQRFSED